MNGEDLYQRVVSTVQETILKIGDIYGSMSLYYPFTGDYDSLRDGFFACADEELRDVVMEALPERIRIIVSESECRYISRLPVKRTMSDVIRLIGQSGSIDDFRESISEKYPSANIREMDHLEFDYLLTFPEGLDPDCYCIAVEMNHLTYHRFSREDYTAMGFELDQ